MSAAACSARRRRRGPEPPGDAADLLAAVELADGEAVAFLDQVGPGEHEAAREVDLRRQGCGTEPEAGLVRQIQCRSVGQRIPLYLPQPTLGELECQGEMGLEPHADPLR